MGAADDVARVLTYGVPPCPCCGLDISEGFRNHLTRKAALPGDAGQYKCNKCGEKINYMLSNRAVVDVLPYRPGVRKW